MGKFCSDENLVKAKTIIHDSCIKILDNALEVPHIVTRKKSENKRKLDADDILKYVVLLDEHLRISDKRFLLHVISKKFHKLTQARLIPVFSWRLSTSYVVNGVAY